MKKKDARAYDLIQWSVVFVIIVLVITLIILIFSGNHTTGVVINDENQTAGRVIRGDNTGVVVADGKSGVVIDGNNSGLVENFIVNGNNSGVVVHGKVSSGVYNYEGDGPMTVDSDTDVVMDDSGSFILATSTTRIKATGVFEIVVVSARTPYAIIDPDHRDTVSIANTSPDTVMIRLKGGVRRNTARIEIGLQRLSAIDVDGAVDVVLRNIVCQRDGLRVKTSGVSSVKSGGVLRGLNATRSTVSIDASGSSMITLPPARNTRIRFARIRTTGSSRVDTRNLDVALVQLDASGASVIRVSASDLVSGVATDAATVNVRGSANVRVSISGVARVKRNA